MQLLKNVSVFGRRFIIFVDDSIKSLLFVVEMILLETEGVFGSIKCDCEPQMHRAMKKLEAEGRRLIESEFMRNQPRVIELCAEISIAVKAVGMISASVTAARRS